MSEPTWLAADLGAASDLSPSSRVNRMHPSPQNTHSKEEDGKETKRNYVHDDRLMFLIGAAAAVVQRKCHSSGAKNDRWR